MIKAEESWTDENGCDVRGPREYDDKAFQFLRDFMQHNFGFKGWIISKKGMSIDKQHYSTRLLARALGMTVNQMLNSFNQVCAQGRKR